MVINYTTIVKSRYDAPFIGTLVAGCTCNANCRGCFNQHLKDMPRLSIDADELLDDIQSDLFSEGIILAGLEWTDGQYDEALYLVENALSRGMQAILYTRHTEGYMRLRYPELFDCSGLYIKFGEYREDMKVHDYISHDVPLASSNQYIIKIK